MTFAKPNPPGWALGDKITSAQMNAINNDLPNAVDKTGDTITGIVHVGTGAVLDIDEDAALIVAGIARVQSSGTPAQLIIGDTSTFVIQDGAVGLVQSGAVLEVAGGAVFLLDDNYPALNSGHPGRTRTYYLDASTHAQFTPFLETGPSGGILTGMDVTKPTFVRQRGSVISVTNSTLYGGVLHVAAPRVQGATLVSASLLFRTFQTHVSVPVNRIAVTMNRYTPATAAVDTMGPTVFPSNASPAAYDAGGEPQTITTTCNAFNTALDFTSNAYVLEVQDETGSGALNNTRFLGAMFNYTNIVDMRP